MSDIGDIWLVDWKGDSDVKYDEGYECAPESKGHLPSHVEARAGVSQVCNRDFLCLLYIYTQTVGPEKGPAWQI